MFKVALGTQIKQGVHEEHSKVHHTMQIATTTLRSQYLPKSKKILLKVNLTQDISISTYCEHICLIQ